MAEHRVLVLCHNHPRVRPGGAEQYAYELHLALREAPDWGSTFLARSGPPLSPAGQPHHATPVTAVPGAPDEYFLFGDDYDFDWFYGSMRHDKGLYTRHLRRFLEALAPDVVHVQHTLFVGYDLLREVRCTLPQAPIVYTLHEFLPICHAKGQMVRTFNGELCAEETPRRCSECFPEHAPEAFWLRKRFVQAQFASVDRFVVPSRLLLERYVAWGLPADRIMLEEYGRLASEPAPRPRAPGEPVTIGFFGQLNQFKGIDVLLEAMRLHLAEPGPHVRLRVHGANLDLQEHTFRRRVEALLGDQELADHVEVMGAYAPGEVSAVMASVDWVVVPSVWWENSPLVIQEAFAAGRPVICSDVGGMAEKVTDGVDGLHFTVGDAAALARVLRRVAGSCGLWQDLRGGIAPVHPMDDHVANMTSMYGELLRERCPASG